jgi:hypothetical protein
VGAVVDRVLAIQAQDARGFRLSVRSRSSGLVASDVDRALTDERSLVVTWLNRGTLHLVRSDDYWWLHPLTTPQLATGNRRRLGQEGVSEAQAIRGVSIIETAVTTDGPQTREQLRARLDASRIPTAGQALVHLLFAATMHGFVVRGPIIDGHHAFVAVQVWLEPAPASLDRDEALARLARRFLAGHGPASARDLGKWAGITLGDARRAFGAIADEVEPFGEENVVLTDRDDAGASLPPPRLLGPFDPLLHGWESREPFVGDHGSVVTTNGIFRPVALVDGRVVATWTMPDGVVTVTPLEPLPAKARNALVTDAADVLRYLELPAKPAVVS